MKRLFKSLRNRNGGIFEHTLTTLAFIIIIGVFLGIPLYNYHQKSVKSRTIQEQAINEISPLLRKLEIEIQEKGLPLSENYLSQVMNDIWISSDYVKDVVVRIDGSIKVEFDEKSGKANRTTLIIHPVLKGNNKIIWNW
ncbi:hypothetical protein EP227_04515 [bacterium]|nr:MAG: hypothetical protein EP227_04515 [bacterium]